MGSAVTGTVDTQYIVKNKESLMMRHNGSPEKQYLTVKIHVFFSIFKESHGRALALTVSINLSAYP